ncbi:MAG: peptide deformylase [bacterium]|nr:peptide deformylase [bacterium]
MKPIVHTPHAVLTTPAKTITSFDSKWLSKLVEDMKSTLEATNNPKGVGLAGPQIGEAWRIFVTRPRENSIIRVFINPEIKKESKEVSEGVPGRDKKLEGCLSIPNVWGKVRRALTLTLRFQDVRGKNHEEEFTGFLATIIQHETDHINGILFTQRVLEQQGKLYQNAHDKDGKEVLEEIQIR